LGLSSPPGIFTNPAGIFSTVAVSSTGIGENGLGWRPALIKPGTDVAGSSAVDTASSAERTGVFVRHRRPAGRRFQGRVPPVGRARSHVHAYTPLDGPTLGRGRGAT